MSNITQKLHGAAPAYARGQLLGRAALLLLAVPGLPLLWRAAARLQFLLRYPYPHDGLEGTLLHEARLLRAGEPLYQPLEQLRFVSAPYPPLHPLLLAWADTVGGPHLFWGGRLISLAAALGIALLVVLTARRVGGAWLGGIIGAAIFLSAPPVLLWATRIKPDLLALLWTAAGLALATLALPTGAAPRARVARNPVQTTAEEASPRSDEGTKVARSGLLLNCVPFVIFHPSALRGEIQGIIAIAPLLLAALCFALAFFTKQTAVAAPLAVGMALLWGDLGSRQAAAGSRQSAAPRTPGANLRRHTKGHEDRSNFVPLRVPAWIIVRWPTLAFGGAYALLVGLVWLLLDVSTGGQFTAHVWGLHRSEWWGAPLLLKFVALLAPYLPGALLALGALGLAVYTPHARVVACYALVVPITLLGAGETGANHNHLLESLLAISLGLGSMAGWLAGRLARRPAVALGLALLLAGQIGLAYRPQEWYLNELAPRETPERYLHFIRNTPGEILADDVALLMAAGRTLRYDDPSTMGPAAASGVWDQRGLLREIAERRFSAIMIPVDVEADSIDASGRWSPEALAAIRQHYRRAFRDTISVYVPR